MSEFNLMVQKILDMHSWIFWECPTCRVTNSTEVINGYGHIKCPDCLYCAGDYEDGEIV